jgi:hypothetical protein
MLRDAFAGGDQLEKEAGDQAAPVDPDEMLKLADGLEHVAQALADPNLPAEASPQQWVQPGTEGAALTAAELGQGAFNPPGQLGQVPTGDREIDNLGGDLPVSNEDGISVTASLRKHARERASAAESRVLGQIKAAAMRRTAAEDPAMTGNLPEDLSSAGEPPTMPPETQMADVPQSTDRVLGLTNDEAEKGNTPDETAALGAAAVQADAASIPEVLEHETGDEEPTIKAAEQAAILRSAVLANIARGG